MTKILIIITIVINFSICGFAQERYIKSEVLDFIKKELKTNVITSKVEKTNLFSRNTESKLTDSTRYQSLSFGLGTTEFNSYGLYDSKFVFSFGLSHQFNKFFFLEIKFDYCPRTEHDVAVYIFSGIPQIAFNLSGDNLKFKTGLGIFLLGIPSEGPPISFTADVKLEYNISKEISIYPEIRYSPLLLTFNVSYKIPL
jgi:hypothetical protein